LQRSQGNLKESLTLMDSVITIIEDLRTKIGSQELRASYFATVQGYYKFYIDLLMQLHQQNPSQGYDALALNVSERSRARSLIELLTEAQANIRSGADPKLLEQERSLQQQLDALEKRRLELVSGQDTDAQLQTLEQERKTLQQDYQQLQEQIRLTSPRYAALKYPQPLTLQQIQQQVLDDDTMLLEYSLGEERSYLWAVTKTGITSYELPKRADIEALAQSFYEQTGKQKAPERGGLGVAPREDSLEVTTKLSQILLSPVAGQLAGKRLLIVSDGALQYLPFAALPEPDTIGKSQNNSANLSPNPKRSPPAPLKKGGGRGESSSPLPLQGRGAGGVRFSSSEQDRGKDKNSVPLIVNHEIVNSPSASTVAIIRQDTNGRKLAPKMIAVIADPVFSKDDERVKTLVGQASRLSEGGDGKISRGEGGQDAHPTSQNVELSVLALTRSAREAGVTFQRLPFTRKESDRILSLIPNTQSQSAFDFTANRATATSPQLDQYQIVHFATHGILNSQNPELSGVVLSLVDEKGTPQNGFLRLNDIFNLNLPAELIVLSACETGLGKEIKGEGLVGLTRGFMYAGATRVLVSLWSVADEGTSELMSRFYKKMLQENLRPAAALRAAQIEMLQDPQWKSPYYWAAFTLQGEWK
jgi:CHAT domain-containing protein